MTDDPTSQPRKKRSAPRSERKRPNDLYANAFLQHLIDRSKLVLDMRSYSVAGEKKTKPVGNATPVKISCISSDLKIDERFDAASDGDLVAVHVGDYCLTAPTRKRSLEAWAKDRLFELRRTIEDCNPDIVCFGELAYPPPLYGPDISSDAPDGGGLRSRTRYQFDEEIQEVLNDLSSDAFVFAGSFHCLRTQYAVGVIFPYGKLKDNINGSVDSEWIRRRKEQDQEPAGPDPLQFSAPIIYKKRNPARSIGEISRIPPRADFQIFERRIGHVAILMCSDILDINQFLGVSRMNLNSPELPSIDYILVPSFNKGKKLPDYCKELSELASAMVINVNANTNDPTFTDTAVHLCGMDVPELLRERVLVSDPNVRRMDLPSRAQSVVTTFEIDPIKTDQCRARHLNSEPIAKFRKTALGKEIEA